MPQYPDAGRSKLARGRMEKTSWRNRSRLYVRCFFFVATFAFWLAFLVFHFSLLEHSHVRSAALSTSEALDSPLIHPSQRKDSLRSSLNRTPEKFSSRITRKPPFSPQPFWRALSTIENKSDPCAGKYVYMHDLPPEFNQKMLEDCRRLSIWTNMCKFTVNAGLGPPLEDTEGVFSTRGWFATNQFAVDVIFHNRMKQYGCLTNDSGKAAVLYVPFYAGLDISRHLWGASVTVRDSASLALAKWLQSRPEWMVMGGRDHFLVGGRITWDFRRLTDNEADWGNKLLEIPSIMNMSMLVVESSPFHTNDFGIPYPTYFHPSQDGDVLDWQNRVRTCKRPALFSFAGAPRPEIFLSIRGQIMDQCKHSESCKLLECDKGESKCHSPSTVMKLFQESVFCLQPQGDSYTRRSIFDSMVAGCIPVFFNSCSAYSQYIWHLPPEYRKYSVYIPENDIRKKNVSIEKVLRNIPPEKVEKMREEVISLIPGVLYADPRHKLINIKDAFDITVQALIDKVTKLRIRITEGREEDLNINEGRSGVPGKAELRDNNEQVTRRWEGQRRNGEEGWSETLRDIPLQAGKVVVNNGKESDTDLNSLEEIWRRDQAEKEALRKASDNVVTQVPRFPNREYRRQ